MDTDAKQRARQILSEQHGWVCYYCGKPLWPDGAPRIPSGLDLYEIPHGYSAAELDHLTPSSRGGSNQIDNLVLCCSACNYQKNNKTEQEYLDWLLGEVGL